MKKLICGVAAAAAVMGSTVAFAEPAPKVILNGTQIEFEAEPYMSPEDRTMVPFRAIFEAANADVMWDEERQTVVAVKDNGDSATSVVLQIGSKNAFVNDQLVELDQAAELKDEYTFVPVRFVMESLGAKVDWDQDTYSVIITTE